MEEKNFTSKNEPTIKTKEEKEFDFVGTMSEQEQLEVRNRMLSKIKKAILQDELNHKGKHKLFSYSKVAASIIVIFAINILLWLSLKADYKTFETGENETKELVLPDGSKVILNSNSQLSYYESVLFEFDRKVELRGEGYFEITKTQDSKRFIVNENELLEVEVFGTQFNFKNQHPIHKLTLVEGSVKLGYKTDTGDSEKMVKPGETVKLNPENHEISTNTSLDPSRLAAWKEGKIRLDNESLKEVLSLVTELYDLKLNEQVFLNEEKLVSGSLPLTDNANEVIQNISILFETKIDLNDRSIRVP